MGESKVDINVQQGETVDYKHQLVWESGMHMFPILWDKGDKVFEKFRNGDLTVHKWNPEIAKRMRKYKPTVLGLDSAPVGFTRRGIDWTWLPGSPKEMNGGEKIYVVGGDVAHQSFRMEGENVFNNELGKIGWKKVGEYAKNAGLEFTMTGILAVIGFIVSSKFEHRNSRRTFLKGGLGAIATAAFALTAGRVAPLIHSYSSNPEYSEYLQKITDLAKFQAARSVWLDGRTALVIAKTLDALETLKLPSTAKASIVMGFPHAYEASPLLNDSEKRAQKIREYALEIERDLLPVILDLGLAEDKTEDREYIRNVILGVMSLSDIWEVREPGVDKTDKPVELIQNSTTLVKHYKSPEVVKALKQL